MSSPSAHADSSGLFHRFVQTEALGGLVLVCCGAAALVIANSGWADAYHHLWELHVDVGLDGRVVSLSLHQVINDGVMALFFLLVGLEIKRELIAGELASPRQSIVPIAGAIGGMVLPAILYLVVNHSGPPTRGWGIPMATDIAFALGALSLIAPNVPTGAKVFLAALAIVDDMGAVLVIAFFYTSSIYWAAAVAAIAVLAALVTLNAAGVRQLSPYLVLGAVLWVCVFASGVHATIAGVLLAFTMPTRTRINAIEFSQTARQLLDEFDRTETGDFLVLTSRGQQEALHALEDASREVTAPLLQLEHALQRFTALVVMPLFAFSNAGVTLAGSSPDLSVSLGVALGLVIGKPLGIMTAVWIAVRSKLAALPAHVSWEMLHGCAWLGGIGFTMALFIAELAFAGTEMLDAAKVGVLASSALASIIGAVVLRRAVGAETEHGEVPMRA